MKIKVENKVTIISDTLKEFFGDKMNLARLKFFGLFISELCKVQTVCFKNWPVDLTQELKPSLRYEGYRDLYQSIHLTRTW
jgi:hypothetical protein